MDPKLALHKTVADFLETRPWEVMKEDAFIAVEIPETKKMYYVTLNELEAETFTIEFNIIEGILGLEHIRKTFDHKSQTFDVIERGHFISLFFEKDLNGWREDFSLNFPEEKHSAYEEFGQPVLFNKIKGATAWPVDDQRLSDLVHVFEALIEVPVKNLKQLKRLNKKTKLETLYKKDGSWQREKRTVEFNYETVKFSDLEIYPFIKGKEVFNEVWYIVSFYESTLVDEDESQAFKPSFFKAGVHLLDPVGRPMHYNDFVGFSEELPMAKKTILEALRSFDMRPKQMMISIKSLYEGLKDFLKALGIQAIYEPEEQTIESFVEAYLLDEDFLEDYLDEEEFSTALMMHFFEAKGITPEALGNFSDEKIENLLKELESIVESLMASCDKELLTNPDLEDLTEEEMTDFLIDYVISGIDEQVKS
jgi:hypothetical protein